MDCGGMGVSFFGSLDESKYSSHMQQEPWLFLVLDGSLNFFPFLFVDWESIRA
jgi:hypothetical protein